MTVALADSPWPAEDGGPERRALVTGQAPIGPLAATWRFALGATMPLVGPDGRVFLMGAQLAPPGDPTATTTAWVEELDPTTLEPVLRSPDLPGGPWWAGGGAVLADGSIVVVHGHHAHRLDGADLTVVAHRDLVWNRPHNSFVVLPGTVSAARPLGLLATKEIDLDLTEPTHVRVLDAATLEQVGDEVVLPETSISRLSATADADGAPLLVVLGIHHVFLLRLDDDHLVEDEGRRHRYRTAEGQGFGWDPVLIAGSAWFLDDGEGTQGFQGTFRGKGVATAPLRLHRVPLDGGPGSSIEVCGRPGGIIANPPIVDAERGIAVAYDSGNGVLVGVSFDPAPDADPAAPMGIAWRRDQDHGAHLLLWPEDGTVLTMHHDAEAGDHAVLLDIATGEERARVAYGSPIQSMLFPAAIPGGPFFVTTPLGIGRVEGAAP